MYDLSRNSLKPFFNVVIVIGALFVIVFCKMRLRDMNYEFLKKSREYGLLQDDYYKNLMIQARLSGPERLEKWGRKVTLDWAREGQVILIIGDKAAISQ